MPRMSGTLAWILKEAEGKMVIVTLKNGKILRGRLIGFDEHLNLILDESEDVTKPETTKKLGYLILRGDTIVLIQLQTPS